MLARTLPIVICIFLCSSQLCYGQDNLSDSTVKLITSKVKNITSSNYYITGIDVDQNLSNPDMTEGKIKDPYHTLSHCLIFFAGGVLDSNLDRPEGFIGIYRTDLDSIIWRSDFVSRDFSYGDIVQTDEINNDRKVEIIVVQPSGSLGRYEQIWIFNWDGKTGKLINQRGKDGTSSLFVLADPGYGLIDEDDDGIYEIGGEIEDLNGNIVDVMYRWNGSLYGKWGKASKYFHKGKRK
jgi:hypothetical protein